MHARGLVTEGRGVYLARHNSQRGMPYVYAIDSRGKMSAWLEFGDDAGRSYERAVARLWHHLDTHDVPRLQLVKSDPSDRPPVYYELMAQNPAFMARAVIDFLLHEGQPS